jgi:hypothetical protein
LLGFVCNAALNLNLLFLSEVLIIASLATCRFLNWGVVVAIDVGCDEVGSVVLHKELKAAHLNCVALVHSILSRETGLIITLRL